MAPYTFSLVVVAGVAFSAALATAAAVDGPAAAADAALVRLGV